MDYDSDDINAFDSALPGSRAGLSLVEASYTVQAADTLQSIAAEYMQKNTYGKREIREFIEGIRQLNEQLVNGSIHTGEVIRINYWIKK